MTLNPVVARELRTRFRGRFAAWGLGLWLVLVSGFGYLAYLGGVALSRDFGFFGNPAFSGRLVFELLIIVLLTGVLIVVPAVGGLSIAVERERSTLPLVQVTQLGPWGLVLGKLAISVVWVVLLLVSVAPVIAIPVVMGGVGFGDLFRVFSFLLAVVVTVGAISVWVSSRAKSLRGAIFGSYLWVFVLVVVTLVLLLGEFYVFPHSRFDRVGPEGKEFISVWANPYVGMASALAEPLEDSLVFNVNQGPTLSGVVSELFARRQPAGFRLWWQQQQGGFFGGFEDFGADVPAPARSSVRTPLWWRTILVYAAITALALRGAKNAVRSPQAVRRRRAPVTEPETDG